MQNADIHLIQHSSLFALIICEENTNQITGLKKSAFVDTD